MFRTRLAGEPGIWHRHVARSGEEDAVVSVDLIVPRQIAPRAGRRGARLPGQHGRTVAQKTAGVEGALVDHDPIEIGALDDADRRSAVINVAGPAALLVAKAFKLGERLETPPRLLAKDAGDVFRLYEAKTVGEIIERLRRVADDERSADVARQGIGHSFTESLRRPGGGVLSPTAGFESASWRSISLTHN